MFIVWEDGGIKTPYTPGSIRNRKVEKVTNTSAIQKTTPHTQDSGRQDSNPPRTHRLTEVY